MQTNFAELKRKLNLSENDQKRLDAYELVIEECSKPIAPNRRGRRPLQVDIEKYREYMEKNMQGMRGRERCYSLRKRFPKLAWKHIAELVGVAKNTDADARARVACTEARRFALRKGKKWPLK